MKRWLLAPVLVLGLVFAVVSWGLAENSGERVEVLEYDGDEFGKWAGCRLIIADDGDTINPDTTDFLTVFVGNDFFLAHRKQFVKFSFNHDGNFPLRLSQKDWVRIPRNGNRFPYLPNEPLPDFLAWILLPDTKWEDFTLVVKWNTLLDVSESRLQEIRPEEAEFLRQFGVLEG